MSEPKISAIPVAFFDSLSAQERDGIYENHGRLNAELCRRVWRMTDRNTEPPESMEVIFKVSELKKAFPEIDWSEYE